MNKFVYVAPPIAGIMIEPLKKAGFDAQLGKEVLEDELLAKCWALVPNRGAIDAAVLDKAPDLKLIVKRGVGVDRIDVDECTKRGICVANTPYSNYISVAEHTIMLLLTAAKNFYQISKVTRCAEPDRKAAMHYQPTEICGKTLSIIGLGHIGMYTAKLALGLGMKVVAYVRHPEKVKCQDGIELVETMEEALRRGDYVSLHVSGYSNNKNLIGAAELEMMKPSAILINTTRGFVVDEAALVEALSKGTIAGAALDVVTKEPVDVDNPLLAMDNVIYTPHSAGNTKEAGRRGYMECVKIIEDFANGKYPDTAVNEVQ